MNPSYPLPQTSPGGLGSYTEVVAGDLSSCCPAGLPCHENNTNLSSISHNCKSKAYIPSIDVHLQNKPQGWQWTQVSASDSFSRRNFLMRLKKYGQVTASGSSLRFYLILEFGSNSCANLIYSSMTLIFIFWPTISIEQWRPNQQHQHHLNFCEKSKFSGPTQTSHQKLEGPSLALWMTQCKLKVWSCYLGWPTCPHVEGFLSLSPEPVLCCPVPQGPPCMEGSLPCLINSL